MTTHRDLLEELRALAEVCAEPLRSEVLAEIAEVEQSPVTAPVLDNEIEHGFAEAFHEAKRGLLRRMGEQAAKSGS